MAIDIELLRLQYEILGATAGDLARSTNMPVDLIQREIEKHGWKPLWPDDDAPLALEEDEDLFTVTSNNYIDKTRKRLQAYALAKEVLLASRYLELESNIVKKACEAISLLDPALVSSIKTLSSIFKDLAKDGVGKTALSVGTDEAGLPTVIIKDLSGRGLGTE